FSGGNPIAGQWASVISLNDSSVTAGNAASGVTVYNSNGLFINNTVIQGTGLWMVNSSDNTGNYGGASIKNLYPESSSGVNGVGSTPFGGLGIAGAIFGATSHATQISGYGGVQGAFPTGGAGATPYTYYIVANDTTA